MGVAEAAQTRRSPGYSPETPPPASWSKSPMDIDDRPIIHCTPPTDPGFLATVAQAYAQASGVLSGELAMVVGTLVRVRADYPNASMVAVSLVGADDQPCLVWLISRDGWTEVDLGSGSRRAPMARTPVARA
jgi:hypothetical protein